MSHKFFSVGCHKVPWERHLPVIGEVHHTEKPLISVPKVHIHLARMETPQPDVHVLSILRKDGKIPGRIEVLGVVSRIGFDYLKKLLFGVKSRVVEINLACLGSFVANGDKKEGLVYCMHDSGEVGIKRFAARDIASPLPIDWFFPVVDPHD
jgi:hypothetical protein